MCDPNRYGFSAVLVVNRVSSLAVLVIIRVWVLRSILELGMFFRSSYFFIIIEETIGYQIFGQVIKKVGEKITDFGHKWGLSFAKRDPVFS